MSEFSLLFYFMFVYHVMFTFLFFFLFSQNNTLPFTKMDFVIAWTFRELGAFYHYLLALFDSRIQWRTRTFYLKWGGLAEEVNPRIWMKFLQLAESCVISWQDSNCVFSRLVIQWNRERDEGQPVCTWWFSWQLNCCVIIIILLLQPPTAGQWHIHGFCDVQRQMCFFLYKVPSKESNYCDLFYLPKGIALFAQKIV